MKLFRPLSVAVCSLLLPLLFGMDEPIKPGIGSIRCEIWMNVDGEQVTDALASGVFYAKPTDTRSLPSFELNPAPDVPQAFAVRGYLVPPATGDYTFVISADDTALLYLSTDQSADNRIPIASVPSYTGVRDYKHYAAQTSRSIRLESGKRYFVEALVKNQVGASHVSVGWTMPDGTAEQPIPGNRLVPAIAGILPMELHADPPKVTLKNESPQNLQPGFHKFPMGAHIEWKQDSIDMSYLVYLPEDFDKTADKKPLLVFLHGNTHQGSDLTGVLNEGPANYLVNSQSLRDGFPLIGLFPQLPNGMRWDSPGAAQAVNALVKKVCEKYPRIDRKRIYLTGLSMGGKGTWLTVLDSPETYAAITTLSAVAVRPEQAKIKLAKLQHVRIICGADDGDFAAGSKKMFETLLPVLGDRVQLEVIPHQGHFVWGLYYPNRDFYEALMQYSK